MEKNKKLPIKDSNKKVEVLRPKAVSTIKKVEATNSTQDNKSKLTVNLIPKEISTPKVTSNKIKDSNKEVEVLKPKAVSTIKKVEATNSTQDNKSKLTVNMIPKEISTPKVTSNKIKDPKNLNKQSQKIETNSKNKIDIKNEEIKINVKETLAKEVEAFDINLNDGGIEDGINDDPYHIPVNYKLRREFIRKIFNNNQLLSHYEKIPEKSLLNLYDLAKYLGSFSDIEILKLALVFLWICKNIKYDDVNYHAGKPSDCTPEGAFKNRKTVCSGYSRLFSSMCKEIGLEIVNIIGYAKGYGYKQGQKIIGTNHEWNAVKLKNQFYLIDSTWASGSDDGTGFKWRFNLFYFLTPPNLFNDSHLPEDSKWQLVSKPLTSKEFESSLKKHRDTFYNSLHENNIDLFEIDSPDININDNNLQIKIKIEKDLLVNLKNENDKEILNMVRINHEFDDLNLNKNLFILEILIPDKGEYKLQIFGRDTSIDSGSFTHLLTFDILANCKKLKTNIAYPKFYNSRNCCLISQNNYYLKKGTEENFNIRVLDKTSVAIIQGSQWHYMESVGNGIYQGKVKISNDIIKINAKGLTGDSFYGLFEFKGIS